MDLKENGRKVVAKLASGGLLADWEIAHTEPTRYSTENWVLTSLDPKVGVTVTLTRSSSDCYLSASRGDVRFAFLYGVEEPKVNGLIAIVKAEYLALQQRRQHDEAQRYEEASVDAMKALGLDPAVPEPVEPNSPMRALDLMGD